MSNPDTPQKGEDTVSNVVDSEPCDTCGGSGATGMGRGFEWCEDCINIPDSIVPDDLPENPRDRLAELKSEQARTEKEQEELKEALDKISEARELVREAAEYDIINDDTTVVLNHLSSRIGREVQPYHRRRRPVDGFDERIYELQQFVDLLDRRQGGE